MDYNQDIHLTLAAEQLDTINHLFTHYNWTYREISRTERNVSESSHPRHSSVSDVSTQTESTMAEGDPEGEHYFISQDQDETETEWSSSPRIRPIHTLTCSFNHSRDCSLTQSPKNSIAPVM